jgi:hypothetical protein
MNNKLCFIHFFEIVGILLTRLLENEIVSSKQLGFMEITKLQTHETQ